MLPCVAGWENTMWYAIIITLVGEIVAKDDMFQR